MSTTIDERVVEMRFDNSQFERNVQTSLSTLDKLKQSLNLDGAAKGFEKLERASEACDMSTLSGAIGTVQAKFSALEVVGITALANITNSAISAGEQLVKSLTIDQVTAGWGKYGQKTASVQTIMNATGKSIDEVNGYLDKLMWFSDETSYGFTDMTSALGQLTSAGGDIDKLIPMITGIANATAFAGKGAAEFSRSIYNLNQSYSAGSLQYMDWRSLELAGIASEQLKQTFIDTGIALGKIKEGEVTIANFGTTLKDKWADTSVMEAAFGKFGEMTEKAYEMVQSGEVETASEAYTILAEQYDGVSIKAAKAAQEAKTFSEAIDATKDAVSSGWMKSFELVFGNYEEAKVLWTDLADSLWDVFVSGGEARNEMLTEAMTSGWSQFLKEGIADAVEFKEIISETALQSGVALKEIMDNSESFEDSLKQGWLTADILSESVDKLADKMESLTDEELKNLGYTQNEIDAQREFIEAVKDGSINLEEYAEKIGRFTGREHLVQTFWNSWEGVGALLSTIRDAFREIFPATTAEQLYSVTAKLDEMTERFRSFVTESEDGLKVVSDLKSTFKGLFAVLDIIKQVFSAVFQSLNPLVGGMGALGGGILGVTGSLGDMLVSFDETLRESEVLTTVAGSIASVLHAAGTAISGFASKVKEKFETVGFESFHVLLERIHERMGQVGDAAGDMKSGVLTAFEAIGSALENCKFLQVLGALWDAVTRIASGVLNAFGTLADTLVEKLGNADFSGIIDLLNGLSFAGIAMALNKLSKLSNGLTIVTSSMTSFEKFAKNVTWSLETVQEAMLAWQTHLKTGTLLKLAAAVGVLAASLVAISLIDSAKLAASLGAITVLFADLMASMAAFTSISKSMGKTGKGITSMLGIATAVLILASALKTVGKLDTDKLKSSLMGIAELTAMVVVAAKVLGSGSGTILKGAGQLVLLSAAIKMMASACEKLSALNPDQLTVGLTGVGALLAELAAFTKLLGGAKLNASTGLAIVEIAAAMKIFASAMADFGQMNVNGIAKGLAAMGGALAEVAVAAKVMPKNMVSMGTGLILAGAALEIIADVLGKLGGMKQDEIARGLVAMGGALAELAVGLKFMNGTLGGSAALLVAAAALLALTPVLSILGAMSGEAIAKSLITIAGAFTIIGVAGTVLTPLVPTILSLAGAFALIGVGVAAAGAGLLAVGAGLSAVAVGLAALAGVGVAGATAIVAALTTIITGVAALIPAIAKKIGEAVVAFAQVITNGAPAIGAAIKAVVLTLADVITECAPVIADTVLELAVNILDSLVTYTPRIVDGIFDFLIAVLEGIADRTPELVKSAFGVLDSFFSGLAEALGGMDADAFLKLIAGIGLLTGVIAALNAVSGMIPGAMASLLGVGAVIAELGLVLAAVGALAQIPGLAWLVAEGGQLLESIGNAIGGFVGGIIGGVVSGITGQLPEVGTNLTSFMTNIRPFIDGASSISPALLEGVGALTEAILLLTGADILTGLASWFTGKSSFENFTNQLVPFGEAMAGFSDAIAGMDAGLVTNAASAGKALAELAASLPNSGGVLGFFAGENDMEAFGEQLVPFGKAMRDYSEAVKGIDTHAVMASAAAGKALSELASTLPNCGGLVSFFTGDNALSDFGDQLNDFGKSMAAYYSAVSGIKPEIVTASASAAQALSELAAGLPDSGLFDQWFGGNQTLSSFGNDISALGEDLGYYYSQIAGISLSKLSAVTGQIRALVSLASDAGGIQNGGISGFGAALTAFSWSLSDFIASVAAVLTELDGTMDDGLGTVTATVRSNLSETLGIIQDYRSDFNTAGKNVAQGFVNGINSRLSASTIAGKNLGLAALNAAKKSLDIHSPSGRFEEVGENVGKGLENGLENSLGSAAETVSNAVDNMIPDKAELDKWIGKVSDVETAEVQAAQSTAKAVQKSSQAKTAAAQATYEAFVEYIEEEEFYDRITTEEKLAQYQKVLETYTLTAEERKKVCREVYTLENQLMEETYQNSMDWIEEEKYYSRLSLAAELAAYKRAQSQYEKGTEKRKKLDREVYSLEKEIYEAQKQYMEDVQSIQEEANQKRIDLAQEYADKVTEINEQLAADIQSLNDQYESELKSRADTLYRTYGLFDAVTKKDKVSGETLTKNLSDQVEELSQWQDELETLSLRDIDSDLLAELQELGPSAIAEIQALNAMTGTELDKYVSLWKQKHAVVNDQAEKELADLRIETDANIAKLRKDAEEQLEEYRNVWGEQLSALNEDTAAQLEQLRKEFGENVGLLAKDTEAELQAMAEASQKILTEAGWDETGQQIVAGLTEGVASSKSSFLDELTNMALAAVEAVESTLDINSPSKVFEQLGSYVGQGFVNGLAGYVRRTYEAGAEMAGGATDGLTSAVSRIAELVEDGIDSEPTIRPVLDLSNVRNGLYAMNGMFPGGQSIELAGRLSSSGSFSGENGMERELRELRSELNTLSGAIEGMGGGGNTFYINGDNPREIASEVSRILQKQVERRGKSWE